MCLTSTPPSTGWRQPQLGRSTRSIPGRRNSKLQSTPSQHHPLQRAPILTYGGYCSINCRDPLSVRDSSDPSSRSYPDALSYQGRELTCCQRSSTLSSAAHRSM